MRFKDNYYDGFRQRWQERVNAIARETDLRAVLIMRSTPTHMVVEVSGGPARESTIRATRGSRALIPAVTSLYSEKVVSSASELHVPDAAADRKWKGNEDLVKFGLGVYLGFPIECKGQVLVTVCALHHMPFLFAQGSPSDRELLLKLKLDVEINLVEAADSMTT